MVREVTEEELMQLAADTEYDFNKWPVADDIPENMKEVTSMSRFMEYVQAMCVKKCIPEDELRAFCCIGGGMDSRNDEDAAYLTVWSPQILDRPQKVWSVSSITEFMTREPEAVPFFFTVKEVLTNKGKPYFQTKCVAIPEETSAKFPAHVQEICEEYKTAKGLDRAPVKRQRT